MGSSLLSLPLAQRLMKYMDDNTIELCINEPGKLFLETPGTREMVLHAAPEITREYLVSLTRTIAGENHSTYNEDEPILSATAPTGERIQSVMPPACVPYQFILSVRRQIVEKLPFTHYTDNGYFKNTTVITNAAEYRKKQQENDPVFKAIQDGDFEKGFKLGVELRRTMIICGGMSSGKTTLANSVFQYVRPWERIGTIEDQEELDFGIPNTVRLLAADKNTNYDGYALMKACMRLRLDRVIIGELRGNLVAQFFWGLMTAAKGAVTTLHADDPFTATELIIQMYTKAVSSLTPADVRRIIYSTIDMMVFVDYDGQLRSCNAIYFPKYDTGLLGLK